MFLGIQLWEVEQTCKTRKWNQDQTFEPWKRCRGYQSESSRFPREIENNFSSLFFLIWQSEVNCIKIYLITWRTRDASLQNGFIIEQTLLHSVGWAFSWCNYCRSFSSSDKQQISPAFPNWWFLWPNLYYLLSSAIYRNLRL